MDTIAALFEWFIYFLRNWGIPIMGAWVAWLMFWGKVKGFDSDQTNDAKDWSSLITSYIGLVIVCIVAWVVIGAIANIIFQGGTTVSGTLGFN